MYVIVVEFLVDINGNDCFLWSVIVVILIEVLIK